MNLLIAIFPVCALISTIISIVAARHYVLRHRKPSFLISFLVTLLTLLLMIVMLCGDELFHWRVWIDGGTKGPPGWVAVLLYSFFMLPFAVIPSVLTVAFYRKRFNHDTPAA